MQIKAQAGYQNEWQPSAVTHWLSQAYGDRPAFFLCRSSGKFETGSAKQEQEEEVDSPSSLPAKKPDADMVYYMIAQDVSCPVVTNHLGSLQPVVGRILLDG